MHAFAQSRSEGAFRALYDVVAPAMLGFARRLAGEDTAAADDLTQEAWVRAIERVGRYDRRASAVAWLNGFVLNCWKERCRQLERELLTSGDELDRTPVARASLWSERPILQRAVASLPDGYRTVLVLHDIEGFTHAEIAAQLDIDEGTSKSQLARARRRLAAMLDPRRTGHER
jgi:RNA polymerase sigma-70 factor (ECF subfamily)